MNKDIDNVINLLKERYLNLNEKDKKAFINSLYNGFLEEVDETNYPKIEDNIVFPECIHIAYAVCHEDCGAREFIVDGSTQRCQYDGRLMFRGPSKEYKLIKNEK